MKDAKIFRIGDTEIRLEEKLEGGLEAIEIETQEWHGGDSEFIGRSTSRTPFIYDHLQQISNEVRNLSDELDKANKLRQNAFEIEHSEEAQESVIAIETLLKYQSIDFYVGDKLRIIKKNLEEFLNSPKPAEPPVEMDDTIE